MLILNNIIDKVPIDVEIKQLARLLATREYHNWIGFLLLKIFD